MGVGVVKTGAVTSFIHPMVNGSYKIRVRELKLELYACVSTIQDQEN